MYKKGNRVKFIWRAPWTGITPGTIREIRRGIITVDWDDNTATKSSIDFIKNNTKKVK